MMLALTLTPMAQPVYDQMLNTSTGPQDTYLRPDGTNTYVRPDGTSTFKRP